MRTEIPTSFSSIDIRRLDLSSEKQEVDLLAPHILAGRIHKSDLFSGTESKTPLEKVPDLK